MSETPRILGIDPGLRVGGFSFGRGLCPLNRRCRLACAEAGHLYFPKAAA